MNLSLRNVNFLKFFQSSFFFLFSYIILNEWSGGSRSWTIKKAKTINLTPAVDRKIEYRSRTKSKEAIISLIKGYASYPEFRNEKTVEAIYQGYRDNKPMKMPFILKFSNGNLRIMSGNTRTDIAQHLGITPKGVLIEVPSK